VVDTAGRETDFDEREWRLHHQDPSLILHARHWELAEVSVTERPLDHRAFARPINREVRRIRRRMEERQQRMLDREDDNDGPLMRRVFVPPRGLVLYAPPERFVP
jgi:hypothetical protein